MKIMAVIAICLSVVLSACNSGWITPKETPVGISAITPQPSEGANAEEVLTNEDIPFLKGNATFRCTECQGMNGKPVYWTFKITNPQDGRSSGTYTQRQDDNPIEINGSWRLTYREIAVWDDFCDENVKGEYSWTFDGEILLFTLKGDTCSDRKGFMSKSWVYVGEGN